MQYTLANLIIQQQIDSLKQVLQNNPVDLSQRDEYGFTPLTESAIVNNIEIAQLLLDTGANPNDTDQTGGTAIYWAVENNNLELCKLLLKHGADPNHTSHSNEAPLVKAILRRQRPLQKLLLAHKADLQFANEYIQTKLLAHRFELRGHVDIVDAQNRFTEVSLEGFFLESTLGIVTQSLMGYTKNFAAKHQLEYFNDLQLIVRALDYAQQLQQCMQYQVQHDRYRDQIRHILAQPLIILPIGTAGHATTIVIYDDCLILCDRRKEEQHLQGIVLYKINHMHKLTQQLMQTLVYEKKPEDYFNKMLVPTLKLDCIRRIMIEPQMTGNCAWANVEASIPAALFLLREAPFDAEYAIIDYQHPIVQLFRHWREWDKKRSLHFMLHDFPKLSKPHQASRASLLAALVFQRCYYQNPEDMELARRIVKLLQEHGLSQALQSYITAYTYTKKTQAGRNFKHLLELIDDDI